MVRHRPFRKIVISLSPIFVILATTLFAYSQEAPASNRKLIVFYSPNCRECIKVKNEIMPAIEARFKDSIKIEYRDTSNIENYKLLLGLKEEYNLDIRHLPIISFAGHFLSGEAEIRDNLVQIVERTLEKPIAQDKPSRPIDLLAQFRSFTPWVIISAGLIDGINPCAFTVIVFFISFLAVQGYRKRELMIIGLIFIFAVFITYLLIGLGVFGFFYRLSSFWFIAKAANIGIGVFSIVLGILATYDFFKFKKTGQTEDLVLQLPAAVKNQIHRVIGLHYRVDKGIEGVVTRRHIAGLTASALITGFLVSILEAVCTGQTYLPTITFILKTTPLKLPALGYLGLYNFMFILPLLLIFILALLGVTSGQFAKFLKKHLLALKILMAVLFFGLGIFLLWRA